MFRRFAKISVLLFGFVLFLSACQSEPDPKIAVQEGMVKLIDTEKALFEAKIDGMEQTSSGPVEFEINAGGKKNSEDKEKQKLDVTLDFNFKVGKKMSKGTFDVRRAEKSTYVRVSKFDMAELKLSQQALEQFMQKWWELPTYEKKDSSVDDFSEEFDQFIQTLRGTELFTNIRKVGEEEIKGIKTRKYQVDLNKEGAQKLIEAFPDFSGDTEQTQLGPGEKAAIADELKETEFTGYVWIGIDDDSMHRVSGTLRITPKDGNAASLDINAFAWDFNKEVLVEKPADATPFNPALFKGVVSGLLKPEQKEPAPKPGEAIDQPLGAKQAEGGSGQTPKKK